MVLITLLSGKDFLTMRIHGSRREILTVWKQLRDTESLKQKKGSKYQLSLKMLTKDLKRRHVSPLHYISSLSKPKSPKKEVIFSFHIF